MATENFAAFLKFVLQEEGGWADNPHDPGGKTMKGITLRTFQAFFHGGTADQLRHITDEQAGTIYRRNYWGLMGCDNLPSGVDIMIGDFGVNAGPSRSVGCLQVIAGVTRDGIDGAITEAAVAKLAATTVITKLGAMQRAHYRALPTYDDFGRGWEARTDRRLKLALELLPARVTATT